MGLSIQVTLDTTATTWITRVVHSTWIHATGIKNKIRSARVSLAEFRLHVINGHFNGTIKSAIKWREPVSFSGLYNNLLLLSRFINVNTRFVFVSIIAGISHGINLVRKWPRRARICACKLRKARQTLMSHFTPSRPPPPVLISSVVLRQFRCFILNAGQLEIPGTI